MADLSDDVAGATTTLLCGSSLGADAGECCTTLLRDGVADDREVIWVSYTRSPEDCVESAPPGASVRGVLAVGDAPRTETGPDGPTVEVVATPADIAALGIKLSRFLSAGDGDLVICFDSVTAMCQYVETDTAYSFLHTIATQLYAADARAHFHLDPGAHDASTVDLFASLCDAVVELDGDERRVRTRSAIR